MKAHRATVFTALATLGGLLLSADAHADCFPCTSGDLCTPYCPMPGVPDDTAFAIAVKDEINTAASLIWPLVAGDQWDMLFDTAWALVEGDYHGSFVARGYAGNPAGWAALKATVKARVDVRERMSEVFNVSAVEMTFTDTADDLDKQYGESCSDTAPANWNAQTPPPGYRLVPSDLADTYTKPYQGGWSMIYVPGANGYDMGRLQQQYRDAAKLGDARNDLLQSTLEFYKCQDTRGKAFADLAVTGRRSFQSFTSEAASIPMLKSTLTTMASALLFLDPPPENCHVPLDTAVNLAVERAFKVANVIRVGTRLGTGQATYRDSFGYIAVSGEDDPPYRPVNVPSSPYQQHDLSVPVPLRHQAPPGLPTPTLTVNTRYFIAETGAAVINASPLQVMPSDPPPTLSSDAEVILYVHGLDGRAEEALSLTEALHDVATKAGKNYVVISMDLPGSGYADKIDHTLVSPLTDVGHPTCTFILGGGCTPDFDANGVHNAPALDFVEDFIVAFVDTLDAQNPGFDIKKRIKAVVGGSLGGNMGLRLGRRTDLPWLSRVVAWSPGSVWDSLADGADLFKHYGVRVAWERADEQKEDLGARWHFFEGEFYKWATDPLPIIDAPLPYTWYRKDWPCLDAAILGTQIDRQETYEANFRTWHWRLATEQLVYSHTWDPETSTAPYCQNQIPMLLLTGAADNYPFAGIYDATVTMAGKMEKTPGSLVRLGDKDTQSTGHSIHDERPHLLASRMEWFFGHPYAN